MQIGTIFQIAALISLPPTSKQVDNSSMHKPRHTKMSKNGIPLSGSHIALKKKVVH
jgi:hypothetical protein